MQLTATLPLKLSGRHYGHNVGFCDLLFSSFRHFGVRELFSEILVIAPPDEITIVRHHAEAWSDFPVRVVSDEEVVPALARFRRPEQVRPWFRQQIIKMAASKMVDTDFYLSLDPDVIAVKTVGAGDLVVDGRALLDEEDRSVHTQWWEDSGSILDVDPNLGMPGMHVTPVLYSPKVWDRCFRRLEEVHGGEWTDHLLNSNLLWTEMSLYFLTLENFFSPDQIHIASSGRKYGLHSTPEYWSREDFGNIDISRLFTAENRGLFAVLSSSARVRPDVLADRLRPWVDCELQPYDVMDTLTSRLVETYGKVVRRLRS
jgi:hypothetical protein